MESVCTEHHHHHHMKYHPLISPKKTLQDLNIPPMKLFSHRPSDVDSLLRTFLPCNGDNRSGSAPGSDDGVDLDSDQYSSDEFRMYDFKVRKCTRSRSHDWTDCPFAHPGEKARRRDPRRYYYRGTVCPGYRLSGECSKGDDCEFAHGVFECWLHPARYRTEACKDGKNCKRKVCFFAHTSRQLRVLQAQDEGEDVDYLDRDFDNNRQCCKYCWALSPTSTLMGMSHFSPPMSPTLSPPMSPMKAVGAHRLIRYADRVAPCTGNYKKGVTYEDVLIAELLGSLEGLNLNETVTGSPSTGSGLSVDVSDYDDNNALSKYNYISNNNNHKIMRNSTFSPTLNNQSPASLCSTSFFSSNNGVMNKHHNVDGNPDIGWINNLLM